MLLCLYLKCLLYSKCLLQVLYNASANVEYNHDDNNVNDRRFYDSVNTRRKSTFKKEEVIFTPGHF